jgi:hypothetical protein
VGRPPAARMTFRLPGNQVPAGADVVKSNTRVARFGSYAGNQRRAHRATGERMPTDAAKVQRLLDTGAAVTSLANETAACRRQLGRSGTVESGVLIDTRAITASLATEIIDDGKRRLLPHLHRRSVTAAAPDNQLTGQVSCLPEQAAVAQIADLDQGRFSPSPRRWPPTPTNELSACT